MKSLTEILDAKNYEKPRFADELYEWAQKKNCEISQWSHQYSSSKKDRIYKHTELSKGLVQKFTEEMLPLSYFAKKFYNGNKEILFQASAENKPYDAIFINKDGKVIKKIEITTASKNEKWGLQKELLIENGRAPWEWNIIGVKNNKTRSQRSADDIITTNNFSNKNERFKKTKELLKEATKKKAEKSLGEDKPYGDKKTVLIVTFDDTGFENKRQEILDYKHSNLDELKHSFEKIILFGQISNEFYE